MKEKSIIINTEGGLGAINTRILLETMQVMDKTLNEEELKDTRKICCKYNTTSKLVCDENE